MSLFIVNMTKKGGLYRYGLKPLVYTDHWQRMGVCSTGRSKDDHGLFESDTVYSTLQIDLSLPGPFLVFYLFKREA